MTRIVYGVSGEGSGHSTRARIVASHLEQLGHDVRIASYDRGYRNLSSHFDVLEIEGLTIGSVNNKVSIRKTVRENLRRLPAAHSGLNRLRDLFSDMNPHVVISDFEPMTAYLAHQFSLPLITLDNQHRMRYVQAPIPEGLEREARLTRAIIRGMIPQPDVSLITCFVQGKPKHDRVFQFPPLVAQDVMEFTHQPPTENHVLVYLTNGFDALLQQLKQLPRERFLIYGCKDVPRDLHACPHLEFKQPSRAGFLADLATSKAVIATAGFTLISEALCLRKPYLAYPMEGQYEQQLNAHQLEQAQMGRYGRRADRDEIVTFLYDLPEFSAALSKYPQGDNTALLAKLVELVCDDAALATHFRHRRKKHVFGR